MAKHDSWTKKKHRSHVSGRRVLRMQGLHERLEREARRLHKKYSVRPKDDGIGYCRNECCEAASAPQKKKFCVRDLCPDLAVGEHSHCYICRELL